MRVRTLALVLFVESCSLLLFELLLTRIFAIVMFAQFAYLAISVALLGIAVGALLLHLFPRIAPPEKLATRLGTLAVLCAVAMLAAVTLSVRAKLSASTEQAFENLDWAFLARQRRVEEIVRPWVLAALLPVLALPFACAGISFAAAFRHFKDRIGTLYAADLCGGALGCALFIPVLWGLSAPDAVSVAVLLAAAAGLVLFLEARAPVGVAVAVVVALGACTLGGFGLRGEVLRVRQAAGFDERHVTDVRWTPLTRVALWEPPDRWSTSIMLDNTSRSRVVTDAPRTVRYYGRLPWSLGFQMHGRPRRVLVLAAGAGSDVAVARSFGHRDITAVELAGDYFDLVRTHFRDVPDNPYLQPGVRTVEADARSFVLNSDRRYDVIEMMQANFYSFGGMLAQAWAPDLMFTREAFLDYFSRLRRHGVVSIGSGTRVISYARTAVEALKARGVRQPHRHIFYAQTKRRKPWRVLLVKPRPFQRSERRRLLDVSKAEGHRIRIDPGWSTRKGNRAIRRWLKSGHILTDDHPYVDTIESLGLARTGFNTDDAMRKGGAAHHLYKVLWLQVALLLGFGILALGVPFVWRGRRQLKRAKRSSLALAYCAALGYGFLGVEIVLIHELVLFLGHPTYSVTVVILSLLVGSGLGSLTIARVPEARLDRFRRYALPAVVAMAAAYALVVAPFLSHQVLGLPLPVRLAIATVGLLPLGFFLGMPFPLGMRILPSAAEPIVPWCWALNGWMSVVAAVLSVFIARIWGFRVSLSIALGAYVLALLLSAGLKRIGEEAKRKGGGDQAAASAARETPLAGVE